MTFIEDLKEEGFVYDHLESENYEVNSIPYKFFADFKGLLTSRMRKRFGDEEIYSEMHRAIDIISVSKDEGMVDTGGWNIVNELESQIRSLDKFELYVVMDTIKELTENFLDYEEDTNELLRNHEIGFILKYELRNLKWFAREEVENFADSLTSAIESLPPETKTVLKDLSQAKEYLKNHDDLRYRKDTLAKAISGLEAYASQLSGKKNIRDACSVLKQDDRFQSHIVNDIVSIWGTINQAYPDVRHGSHKEYDLTFEDTVYWIDRIMAQISYLNRITGIQLPV
ncbi:hypothetical protein ACTHQ4_16415 [Alkalicoccobacillus gibsonii]|uniref:hypothetical protein n=1 Tax=Alkalicoccobacillus gibsonii TaxID=79881 RepID=UPI003F7C592D